MPLARIAALSLFVLLFAAAWSGDSGLRAETPSADSRQRLRSLSPDEELPTPSRFRQKMARGHDYSSHRPQLAGGHPARS